MGTMGIQYRRASEDDMSHIRELLASVRGNTGDLRHEQFILACTSSEIIGCVRIKELATGARELASLAVAIEWRERGVGSTLVSSVLSAERGRPVYLLCADERKALYARQGFDVIKFDELPPELRDEYLRVAVAFAGSDQNTIAMALDR